MGTMERFDDRSAASGAGLGFMAALDGFFAWWGEHRAWPANEPAQMRDELVHRPPHRGGRCA